MYSNFEKTRESLSWLKNYHEALLVVYDIVVEEERGDAMVEGREFNEDVYMM